ncbi:MAG TPA: amidohydrolase family protein, partial [Acidimicrobiales bacterium]|nr:amidohydrolase family protein [Acidimicrobiales bacterium]
MWRLFTGGRIYTADDSGSWAEAVAVYDGRFFAVGSAEEVRAQVPAGTAEIDLRGRTATPGLIDAHNHFLQTAESLSWLDARYPGVSSIADLLRLVAEGAKEREPGQWLYVFGLNYRKFLDGRMPTRWDLDQVSGDHPVLVHHVSGHHALVNTLALHARAGQNPKDPKGGTFLRDANGQPNGWCLDAAMGTVVPVVVNVGDHGPNIHFEAKMDALVDALEAGSRAYLSVGLTAVCDAQVTRRELAAYRECRRQGRLGIRVVCMPLSHQLDDLLATGVAGPLGDEWLSLGPMKLYADGALTGGTACFREPYGESG